MLWSPEMQESRYGRFIQMGRSSIGVTLPKPVCNRIGIRAGRRVLLEGTERTIILTPVDESPPTSPLLRIEYVPRWWFRCMVGGCVEEILVENRAKGRVRTERRALYHIRTAHPDLPKLERIRLSRSVWLRAMDEIQRIAAAPQSEK